MSPDPAVLNIDVLRENAWFAGLPTAIQELVVQRSTIRTWRRGETVQHEGEPVRGLEVVLSGRVRCTVRSGSEREAVVHIGGVGFWYGVNVMQADTRAEMSLVADTAVRVLALSQAEFERIVDEHPRSFRLFAQLAFGLGRTLMRYLGELPGLSRGNVLRVRLADMAWRARQERRVDGAVELVLSQADLASLVGMSRQRLNQRLRALQDEGLVQLGFRRILVPDPARLRASAGVDPLSCGARSALEAGGGRAGASRR